jgi:tetratricopeptide (TPR) repeat protein
MRKLVATFLGGLLTLSTVGCLKKMILDGQIASTRKASAAVNTVSDYEVARGAAMAGLAQFEGMYYLAPDNEDALFLLARGWAGVAFGFIEDDMEAAADAHGEDSEIYEYHKARAAAAYARAFHYGSKLLDRRNPGFKEAQRNADTMRAWLAQFEDAENDAQYLLWTGQAWLGRINVRSDDETELVAEANLAAMMIERSVELDETYNWATGHTVLGAYHARSAMAELDDSKKHFERALALNGGRNLLTKLNFATRYYCTKVDKAAYQKLLEEVLGAGDVLPEARLLNSIAKRRARRFLGKARMDSCGFN